VCELSYQQASNASLSIVRCCTTLAVSSFARAPPPRAGGGARGGWLKILLHLPRTTRRPHSCSHHCHIGSRAELECLMTVSQPSRSGFWAGAALPL